MWFLILGFALFAGLASMFDVQLRSLTAAPGDTGQYVNGEWR